MFILPTSGLFTFMDFIPKMGTRSLPVKKATKNKNKK